MLLPLWILFQLGSRIHLSHEMQVQLGKPSHSCIIFMYAMLKSRDFVRENFNGNRIQTHVFFMAGTPSLQVLGLLLVTRHGRAPTCSQYSGEPSSCYFSHYFNCQQSNQEPVHPVRVDKHGFACKPTLPGSPIKRSLCNS